MSRVRIKLNKAGVRELLKSSEVAKECMDHARQIQSRAGEHYIAETRSYPERTGAAVYPADSEGYFDNLRNNTLVRSMK
jgi:hypothetical protein